MAKRQEEPAFFLEIAPLPGLGRAEASAFVEALQRYLEDHGLTSDGGQLAMAVQAAEHQLTETDQVDLLAWLVRQPDVSVVRISALAPQPAGRGSLERGSLTACGFDPCLAAAMLLYRWRRIDAATFIGVLGGFVRRVPL